MIRLAWPRWFVVLSVLTVLVGGTVLAADGVPGEILIRVSAAANAGDVSHIEAVADADRSEVLTRVDGATIRRLHSRSQSTQALLVALSHNPVVEYAEPNYVVHAIATPNDPRYGELWGLKNTGQIIQGFAGKAGADIKAEGAWDVSTGSSTVVVGVVDTGVDYTHPDLSANSWSNPGSIGGCAAGTHGFNAITKTCNPMDDQYHGTHVAGTIGASGNNGVGVVGVNWTTSIMGLKFLDSTGSGTTADAISAIDFAVNAKIAGVNVRVLNNSWGGGGFSQALLDEINKAGANDILFVAAAGNSSADNDRTPHYPSSYNSNYILAVAATDNNDQLASFSNYGATSVDLAAPGVDILSCQPGNRYQYLSGTSMATPHVTGAAALVLAKTNYTALNLKSQLMNTTDSLASLSGFCVTGGRLNVCRAIGSTTCGGAPPPPPPTADTTPPTVPGNLAASPAKRKITLSWTASTDNVGVTGYNVLRSSTSTGTFTKIGTSTTTGYTDSGLTTGTTWFYQVTAYDAAGNVSAASNTASAVVK